MLSAEGSVTCTPASPLPEAGVSRTQSCSGLESNSGVFQPTEGNEGKREGKGRDGEEMEVRQGWRPGRRWGTGENEHLLSTYYVPGASLTFSLSPRGTLEREGSSLPFPDEEMKPREGKQAAPGPHSNLVSGRTRISNLELPFCEGHAVSLSLGAPWGEASRKRGSVEETLRRERGGRWRRKSPREGRRRKGLAGPSGALGWG